LDHFCFPVKISKKIAFKSISKLDKKIECFSKFLKRKRIYMLKNSNCFVMVFRKILWCLKTLWIKMCIDFGTVYMFFFVFSRRTRGVIICILIGVCQRKEKKWGHRVDIFIHTIVDTFWLKNQSYEGNRKKIWQK